MVEGPGADSEEKHEPVSDIDTAAADSLKVLDLKRPIREADMAGIAARSVAIDPEQKSAKPSPSLEKLYLSAHDTGLQTLSGNGICHQFAQTKFVERSDGG